MSLCVACATLAMAQDPRKSGSKDARLLLAPNMSVLVESGIGGRGVSVDFQYLEASLHFCLCEM